jgi:hypothetical protein
MSAPLLAKTHTAKDSFELRWSQWRANAALHDVVLQKRAVTTATLVGCGVAVWLAVAIYVG